MRKRRNAQTMTGKGVYSKRGTLIPLLIVFKLDFELGSNQKKNDAFSSTPMIFLPLRPVSLTHKNRRRRTKVHGMRLVGPKDRPIDVKMFL